MVFLEVAEKKERAFRIKLSSLLGLWQLSTVDVPGKMMLSVCWNFIPIRKTIAWTLPINIVKPTKRFCFPLEWNLKLHVLLEYQLLSILKLEHRSHNLLSIFWWLVLASPCLENCAQIATALKLAVLQDLRAYKVLICYHGLKGGTSLAESPWDTLPFCEVLRNLFPLNSLIWPHSYSFLTYSFTRNRIVM